MHYLKKIDSAFAAVEKWLIVVFLSTMITFTFIHVCLRIFLINLNLDLAQILLKHLEWSQPLVRLLVLWVAFIGASLVTRDNKHIRIDLLGSVLDGAPKSIWSLVTSGASLAISLFLVKASIGYLISEIAYNDLLFLRIPAWIGHLVVPGALMLISLRFFISLMTALDKIGNDVFRHSPTQPTATRK
ncbi:MAG: TRAP transporter small permease subunit [Deltaproteobacteria bacterium]|nr:TRAP transporter small permease subunit [Deltaproteobacteria bacterium]MBW2082091.1 TRAP transporter small permease subunit [Deltaproteobacteria bacterium]